MFQAAIKGSLPITVSWLKDNDEVIEDNNIKMTFVNNIATLLVRSIELKHDGKYFCQAKNEAGIQRCSALLTVKGWSKLQGSQQSHTVLWWLLQMPLIPYLLVYNRTCYNCGQGCVNRCD